MPADDQAAVPQQAPRAAADDLLGLISGMLRELRPGALPRGIRLDDSIDRDIGLDSLSRMELVLRIEKAFGVRISEHVALSARTPRELLDAILCAEQHTTGLPPTGARAEARVEAPDPVEGTPEHARTIVEAFRWHLERHPEREHITLSDGERTTEALSYQDLWKSASDVARGLADLGVGRRDAVAIMLPTGSAFFEVFLATLLLGAVPVPMYPPTRWADIEDHVRGRAAILANSLASLLVTVRKARFLGQIIRAELPGLRAVTSVEELRGKGAAPALSAAAGDEVAMLQYTSGSTGDPKGVVLTHANLLANIRAMGVAAQATARDRFVSWLPLYHDMGLIGAWMGTLYHAVPLVLMSPTHFLARPVRWLWTIDRHRATISAGPNFAYEIAASRIAEEDLEGLDLSTWRLAFNGAEPVRAATLERFAARFARYGFERRALTPVYGLAESAVGLAFPPLDRGPRVERVDGCVLSREGVAKLAMPGDTTALEIVACGMPLPGHELRVVDTGGRELPERAEGRIEFRGPSATAGYYRNEAATQKLIHEDDWLDTGDIGYIAGGELYLTSRAKDLIKRGGRNIYPYDLEAAVGNLPGLRKGCAVVFGTADRSTGTERVIVVAETNATEASAQSALRDRIMELANVHLGGPADDIVLVPARTVPKTSSGKLRRSACRELYEQGTLQARHRPFAMQLARLVARAAAARAQRAARALLRLAYGGWVLLAGLVLALVGLLMLLVAPTTQGRAAVARVTARVLLRIARMPVTLIGSENFPARGAAVLVANHASYIDAIVLQAVLPDRIRFAAKREFAVTPLLGFVFRRLGVHFVGRVDPVRGVDDTRELTAAVRRGESILLFPEGTFSRIPGLAAFHLGAFVIAAEAQVPVVAIVLRGTRSVLRAHQWLPARHPVTITVQPRVMPEGSDWSAAVRLRDRVREAMLRDCAEPDIMG